MALRFQLAEAFVKLTLDDKGFLAQLSSIRRRIGALTGRAMLGGAGLTSGGLMRNLLGTAGIGALVAATGKAAAGAQEMEQRFNQVFRELAPQAKAFSVTFAESLNRSFHQVMDTMANFQLEFTSQGMGREKALEMSKSLTVLTQDLAAFHNMDSADVGSRIFRAMVGNHRALYELGVVLNQAALEQQALNMGFKDGFSKLDPLSKMLVRYNYILRATADAQGQARREMGNLASQWQQIKDGVHELAITIGASLTPAFLSAIGYAQELLDVIREIAKAGSSMPMWSDQGKGPGQGDMAKLWSLFTEGYLTGKDYTAALLAWGDDKNMSLSDIPEVAAAMAAQRQKKPVEGTSPEQLEKNREARRLRLNQAADAAAKQAKEKARHPGGVFSSEDYWRHLQELPDVANAKEMLELNKKQLKALESLEREAKRPKPDRPATVAPSRPTHGDGFF